MPAGFSQYAPHLQYSSLPLMRDQYIFAELTWRSRRGPGSEGTSVRLVKMVGLIVKNFNWMCNEYKPFFKICLESVQVFFHLTVTCSSCKLPVMTEVSMSQCLISIICRNQGGYFILCHSLLLMPSIFPNIRVFSSESALHIRWPTCWSFSFSIGFSNEYSGLISQKGSIR